MESKTSKGRIIKKDSDLAKAISLIDYSFNELASQYTPSIFQDNPSKNVIYRKLHADEEIKASILENSAVYEEITNVQNNAPIIMPYDFTKEYERKKRKTTMAHQQDDDYHAIFDEEMKKFEEEDESAKSKREATEAAASDAAEQPSEQNGEKQKKENKNQETLLSELNQLPHDRIDASSLEKFSGSENNIESDNASEQDNAMEQPVFSAPSKSTETNNDTKTKSDEFISSMDSAAHFDSNSEQAAAQQYKDDQEKKVAALDQAGSSTDSISEGSANHDQLLDEIKEKGYQEGLKQGEEQAKRKLDEVTSEIVENFNNIIEELKKVKKGLLQEASKNFYEIAQTISESLIQRQLSLEPHAFTEMIEKIIDENLKDDSFTLFLSQETFDAIRSGLPPKLLNSVKIDPNIQNYDFKIDANLTTINGDIKKQIKEIISKIEEPLVEDTEKAG